MPTSCLGSTEHDWTQNQKGKPRKSPAKPASWCSGLICSTQASLWDKTPAEQRSIRPVSQTQCFFITSWCRYPGDTDQEKVRADRCRVCCDHNPDGTPESALTPGCWGQKVDLSLQTGDRNQVSSLLPRKHHSTSILSLKGGSSGPWLRAICSPNYFLCKNQTEAVGETSLDRALGSEAHCHCKDWLFSRQGLSILCPSWSNIK